MIRNLSLISVISIAAISLACTTATAPSNSAATNTTTTTVPANSANLPPEFSGNAVPTNSTTATPGIPDPKTATGNNVPKGTTSTPGIPSAEDLKKPQPKNTPKIPGIPSDKELKEMMNRKVDPSEVNNPKGILPKQDVPANAATNSGVKTVGKPKINP